jgi:Tfp pilus assembly protein PilP
MKKSFKIKLIFVVILQLVLFSGAVSASAQERDPFSPTSGGVMSRVNELVNGPEATAPATTFDAAIDPLTATQLSGYKVSGIIISDTKKLASVKGMNGVSYIVKVGDNIGSEGGKISDITLDSITVQTQSQEVKIPVSNIIEVPVGNAVEKKI